MSLHGRTWHFLGIFILVSNFFGISSIPVNDRKQMFSGKNKPPLVFSVRIHLAYTLFL